jgi:hypothetical protein
MVGGTVCASRSQSRPASHARPVRLRGRSWCCLQMGTRYNLLDFLTSAVLLFIAFIAFSSTANIFIFMSFFSSQQALEEVRITGAYSSRRKKRLSIMLDGSAVTLSGSASASQLASAATAAAFANAVASATAAASATATAATATAAAATATAAATTTAAATATAAANATTAASAATAAATTTAVSSNAIANTAPSSLPSAPTPVAPSAQAQAPPVEPKAS